MFCGNTHVTCLSLLVFGICCRNPVDPPYRSRVNVPVLLGTVEGNKDLEALFVEQATAAGLIGLKGHR